MPRKLIMLISLCFFSFVIISCSQPVSIGMNGETDAYEFPVKPGMTEWAAFNTHDEMLEACQIPESILKTMSTNGLIETILDYPLRMDIFLHDNVQTGFDVVESQFNGIPELLIREDAATELLAKYCSLNVSLMDQNWEPADRAKYTLGTVAFVEILLSQDDILSKMNDAGKISLITEALNKSTEKGQLSGTYGSADQLYTVLIIARVLQQENYAPFIQKMSESDDLRRFIDNGSFVGTDVLNELVSMAQGFLTQT